jgi:hypothetical protein
MHTHKSAALRVRHCHHAESQSVTEFLIVLVPQCGQQPGHCNLCHSAATPMMAYASSFHSTSRLPSCHRSWHHCTAGSVATFNAASLLADLCLPRSTPHQRCHFSSSCTSNASVPAVLTVAVASLSIAVRRGLYCHTVLSHEL